MATRLSSPAPSNLTGTTFAPPPAPAPTPASSTFTFPNYTSFPPFYTLQPNLTTRARQLTLWSSLITAYCTSHHIFKLSLSSLPTDLFANPALHRSLSAPDIRLVLDHLALSSRAEWIPAGRGEKSNSCWVFWRSLAEWADAVYGWVDETGQKGAVLTVYELREGEAVSGREWEGMDEEFLRKVLGVIVKRGKAQVFGEGEGAGVKFF